MRDIEDYANAYAKDYDFEKYQIQYRRKKVLEVLNEYNPKSLLEIGCGPSPIGLFYDAMKHYTIVEPSVMFCKNAQRELRIGGGATLR